MVTAGRPGAEELQTIDWSDVVAVAAGNVHAAPNTGRSHSVGLRSDGTVLATGWDKDGQCDVHEWRDIVTNSAGWRRTLAVAADGTARAAGRRAEGACDLDGWTDVVAVAAGDWHSVGLRRDGTVVATGNNRR